MPISDIEDPINIGSLELFHAKYMGAAKFHGFVKLGVSYGYIYLVELIEKSVF